MFFYWCSAKLSLLSKTMFWRKAPPPLRSFNLFLVLLLVPAWQIHPFSDLIWMPMIGFWMKCIYLGELWHDVTRFNSCCVCSAFPTYPNILIKRMIFRVGHKFKQCKISLSCKKNSHGIFCKSTSFYLNFLPGNIQRNLM